MKITTIREGKRGCGFRKAGGFYLRTDGMGRYCGALPIELTVCPTCHHGIKPARGWTWVNLAAFASVRGCKLGPKCGDCPIADAKIQEVGLIWVGEKYYPSTRDFSEEAKRMGISRRITQVPKRFKLGETWVALAHRKAIRRDKVEVIPDDCLPSDGILAALGFEKIDKEATTEFVPGIFHVFKPSRIEYCVGGHETDSKLESLEKRGITLVKIIEDHSSTTTTKAAA